jgi:uncharacterized LabA/DUF88 family protein
MIAVDMLAQAMRNHYDTALLLARDGDYAYVVEHIKDLTGKYVYDVAFPRRHAYHLMNVCDKSIDLSDDVIKNCQFQAP